MPRPVQPQGRTQRAPLRWRFGHALALAVVLVCTPAALAEPTWVMVPGTGVGRVRLGMTGPDLITVLGAPTAYCALSASGDEQQSMTVLYYPNRGLALTLNSSRSGLTTVARIHIVAGYSATLSDEPSPRVNGRGYRKCSPHATLTLDVSPGRYITNNGIRPGSSVNQVVSRFGAPKAEYPAVAAVAGDHLASAAEMESLLVHRLFLLPYRARILVYDGIIFGIYNASVVAVTIDWGGYDPYRTVAASLHPQR